MQNVLASGDGEPSHVRALFGDVSLATLLRLAMASGVSDQTLAEAYAAARRDFAAANPELDDFARQFGL